jgi:hypothetical protein
MRMHLSLASFTFLIVAGAFPAAAQSSAHIVYTFDNPKLQPAHYTITVDEKGAGRFVSQPGEAPPDSTDDVYPAAMDRDVRLDETLNSQLFSYARAHRLFQSTCDRGQAGLAFTGNKTLAYEGSDGKGSCTFVWAADPVLQRISDDLGSVALTLEIGRRLDVEVRHDRLGLDAELESLEDAVKDRRAVDVSNIAPQLQTIASDDQVMDRARRRALVLLSKCETSPRRN